MEASLFMQQLVATWSRPIGSSSGASWFQQSGWLGGASQG